MLDLKFIRENTELVRKAIADRHDSASIDEILELDTSRHQKLLELEG
ncbi:MAG: serine--tRNA ligase, partial [Dehalococcoidales bacterium]|nr:serine--tRNA ligase [Dehalococcoidales bacterium]